MKRPEGFDDGPARPDPAAEDAPAPRQRRAPRLARRPFRGSSSNGQEARLDAAPPAPADETVATTDHGVRPGAARDGSGDGPASEAVGSAGAGDDTADARSVRDVRLDRASALAGAAGRRLGAGWSSVADRLREYTPDEDHHDPDAPHRGPGTVDGGSDDRGDHRDPRERRDDGDRRDDADHRSNGDDGDPDATVTDVIDPDRASWPDRDRDDRDRDGRDRDGATHATPIGAGVRAAETAREARVAKRRRRLLERAEVRRFTRRSRHRRAAWITAAGIVVVFGVSILVAVFSPLMALQTIEVKGTNRVDASQLEQALSDQLGTPLARLDFDAIKQDVAGFPLIESYVTEEAPPHTLVVTVTERTPVVAVRSGKSFDLVDPAGIVVQTSPTQPATMPVADIGSAQLGSSVFRTMTEVVLALPSTVRQQVTAVKASTADDVTLTLKDGSSVVWGNPDESDAKAALLAALMKDHAARNPGVVVEYDVSAPDNGIIRSKK